MYAYRNPEQVFGSFGATGDWWDTLNIDAKILIQNWITDRAAEFGQPLNSAALLAEARRLLREAGIESPRITNDMLNARVMRMILETYARPVADGGGFVVPEPATGVNHCMCPGSSPDVPSAQLLDAPCPPGTGGVPLAAATASRPAGRTTTLPWKVQLQPKPRGSDATKATIKGKVTGASGVGIAGAAVNVGPPGGGSARVGMAASVVTGADGSFSVDVIPGSTGTVDVAVTAAGYVGATALGVVAIRGQTTSDVRIPLAAAGGAPPPTCDPGFVLDLVTAACVPVPGDGDDGFTCPEGSVLSSDGVSCIALGEKTGEAAKPWYKRTSTWLIVGGVVVVGGGIAVVASRRRR